MRKLAVAMLTLALVLSCCLPFAGAEQSASLTGWGAWTFNDQTGITSYSQQYLWQEVKSRLGVDVTWTTVSANDKKTQFSLLMASGDLPDIIADMEPIYYEEFGRLGALIPLNDYINAEKMPNLSALIKKDPAVLASITSADGNIYFFPRIMEEATRYWNGLFIRGDYLNAVGKTVPTTLDEYYDALSAIKNGIEGSASPISMNAASLKTLIWAYGIGARGTGTSPTDDAYIKDGAIAYGPIDEKYREALAYLHKLYAQGLINPDWNAIENNQIRTNIVSGSASVCQGSFAGVLSTYNNLLSADGKGTPLTYILPMTGPYGDQAWQGHHTAIDLSYGLAITSTCDDVDSVIKMVDYLYGDEGRELVYWGVEGVTYNKTADGYSFTEAVTGSDLGILNYLNNYSANTSCYSTAMITAFYHSTLSEIAREGNLKQTAIGQAKDIRLPALRYTEDEIAEVNTIIIDLNDYVDENFALFVNGTKDILDDAQWKSYIDGFASLRLDELLSYYNGAYQRWVEVAGQ